MTRWFGPGVTDELLSDWFVAVLFPSHKVSRWAEPNSNRVDGRYWFIRGVDAMAAASRFFVDYNTDATQVPPPSPSTINFGTIDLLPTSGGDISGALPADVNGYSLSLRFHDTDSMPFNGLPGVAMIARWEHPTEGHREVTAFYPRDDVNFQWHHRTKWDYGEAKGFNIDQAPQWPNANFQFRIIPVSSCYDFPGAPVEGAAEFNGVDTSIFFDGGTNFNTDRFQLQMDFKLNDVSEQAVILARGAINTQWMSLTRAVFRQRFTSVNISPLLPLGEWGTFRAEYNWNDPGTNWKLYWNDSLVGVRDVPGFSSLPYNRMGHGSGSSMGNFSMRNLTWQDGSPATPRRLMTCELIDNACDVGEQLLKGTTAGMSLPSCP